MESVEFRGEDHGGGLSLIGRNHRGSRGPSLERDLAGGYLKEGVSTGSLTLKKKREGGLNETKEIQ